MEHRLRKYMLGNSIKAQITLRKQDVLSESKVQKARRALKLNTGSGSKAQKLNAVWNPKYKYTLESKAVQVQKKNQNKKGHSKTETQALKLNKGSETKTQAQKTNTAQKVRTQAPITKTLDQK